ncbi:oligosaccharide flippase family protein [Leptothoe sp. EHU-05/26/07-4]
MNKISRTLKHKLVSSYSIYLGSNILSSAIPFIFLPILTRYLSPADYGLVITFKILLTIFSILIGVNTHGALTRTYFKLKGLDFQKYLYNLLIICFSSFLLFLFITPISFKFNPLSIDMPQKWILFLILFSLFEAFSKLLLSLWRAQEKSFSFGLFNILKALLNVALSALLIIHLKMNWQGRILGIIITGSIFGLIALYKLWRNHISNDIFQIKSIDINHIRNALFFGLPLIPHALSGWMINYIDRFFIASMIGMSEVGIYSVAYQIGNIIGILALSFNQAWSPFLFKQLSKNNNQVKLNIVRFTYAYFLIICILAISLSLFFSVIAPFVVGKAFQCATQYVIWVALGYAANGMYFMIVNYIFYAEKNYYLTLITLFSALVNIILNYVLIIYNGAIGAAQATTITYAITFLLSWHVAKQVYAMPWNLRGIK